MRSLALTLPLLVQVFVALHLTGVLILGNLSSLLVELLVPLPQKGPLRTGCFLDLFHRLDVLDPFSRVRFLGLLPYLLRVFLRLVFQFLAIQPERRQRFLGLLQVQVLILTLDSGFLRELGAIGLELDGEVGDSLQWVGAMGATLRLFLLLLVFLIFRRLLLRHFFLRLDVLGADPLNLIVELFLLLEVSQLVRSRLVLEIRGATFFGEESLPQLSDFLHDDKSPQRWIVHHDAWSGFLDEDHVGRQTLFGPLECSGRSGELLQLYLIAFLICSSKMVNRASKNCTYLF